MVRHLAEREKEIRQAMIDHGQSWPPTHRLSFFADAPEVESIWLSLRGEASEESSGRPHIVT